MTFKLRAISFEINKVDGIITKQKKEETHSLLIFLYASFPPSQTVDHFDPKL